MKAPRVMQGFLDFKNRVATPDRWKSRKDLLVLCNNKNHLKKITPKKFNIFRVGPKIRVGRDT